MTQEALKKLTLKINTAILVLVFVLMGFFAYCKADFLIWFSIPTAMVYILGYILIVKGRLTFYVRLVYSWLTLYMSITTICLGYKFGFHLYTLSMVPIVFYTEYMAYKLGKKTINSIIVCCGIVSCYLASTVYAACYEPVYETGLSAAAAFWVINSVTVFSFLVFYMSSLIKTVISSEKKLTDMALSDNLTGLYNRHYMMGRLKDACKDISPASLAMADIDNFKKINDTYGHNAGDFVLKKIAKIMKDTCTGAEISRWGGEEFLILFVSSDDNDFEILEKLRLKVFESEFVHEDRKIPVTLTIGYASKKKGCTPDSWIKDADSNLYKGKEEGKNRVIG